MTDRPHVRVDGAAREQGRVYQAARDQIINKFSRQGPRRPLPPAGAVRTPAGPAGLPAAEQATAEEAAAWTLSRLAAAK
ncbi:MAG: hypothetical protein HOV97_00215 [Nonomuraea sp.]|nr:hypothetical protein [Nonomuraea sp.]